MMKFTHTIQGIVIIAIVNLVSATGKVLADDAVIGVLAPMGHQRAKEMWQPTIDYLQKKIPQYTFKLFPANKKLLSEAVSQSRIDLILTNSGHYIELEATYGATRILTLKKAWQGHTYNQWGGVIVTLSGNRDVQTLEDIKSESFAAVSRGAFAGFQMAFRELLDAGIMSHDDIENIVFTGYPHNSPLKAVFDGVVEAGTIPTGVLEEAMSSGKYQAETFRVISPKNIENFPFQLSTRLYPQWPLSKSRHTSDILAEKVVATLLDTPDNHQSFRASKISGWTVPMNYSEIHNLLREIRMPPYKEYGRITLLQLLQQYWQWLVVALVMFGIGVSIIVYVIRINGKLFDAHNTLESKVDESTKDLKHANKQLYLKILEQERLHAEIMITKNSLSRAQEIAHLGNWDWDMQTGELKWSDEVYQIFGTSRECIDTTYENFIKYVHPEDREVLEKEVQRSVNNPDVVYSIEHRIIRDNGVERYVYEQGEVICEDNGKPVRMLGTIQDVTDRKLIEMQLEQAVQDEEILGRLMQLSLSMVPLEDYLNITLQMLTDTVKWFKEKKIACIFLVKDKNGKNQLEMAAEINLNKERKKTCSIVPFGTCLCGEAAANRTIVFTSEVDHRHYFKTDDNDQHGHYCVPIEKEEKLLGVLMIQLPEGHESNTHEYLFLRRIADVLSMGISRHQAEDEIEHHAYHDTLTNLPNRRLLLDRLNQEFIQSERSNVFGSVIYIDLDNFKTLNDSLGHPTGDKLLLQVADRLTNHLRKDDTVARIGGDEFVIIMPSLGKTIESAVNVAGDTAEKIRLLLREPYWFEGHQYHATVSLGVAIYPKDQDGIDDVLQQADSALYEAKKNGRDRAYFFQAFMQEAASKRLALEHDIRQALNENQFMLYFQPQVDVVGTITGAEALLRWYHPVRGFVSPDEFIPVAEECGLIVPLGNIVVEMACAFLNNIENIPVSFTSLSVNISPKQFKHPDFVSFVKEKIAVYNVSPDRLILEVTEGVLVDNPDDVASKMHQLKELSIQFSIDDFGTGYSSMTYLKNLPLAELKIDQSFIRDVPENTSDVAIIEAIISMAKHLGLRIVAEGVETEEQLLFLKQLHCQIFQGYYFDKPLSQADFLEKYFHQKL